MRQLASEEHDSILRDTVEGIKHFSWDTITLELQRKVPTLMQLLRLLVKKPAISKPFISCLASQLVKDRHPKLGLMQRAVSVMLYGNGSSKQVRIQNFFFKCQRMIVYPIVQVFKCLSKLKISLSYTGMLYTIQNISQDYDAEVQHWSDCLKEQYLLKQAVSHLIFCSC